MRATTLTKTGPVRQPRALVARSTRRAARPKRSPNKNGPNPGGRSDPTGLYHFGARQYDATTGRFTSTDPADAVTGSTYAYADDRPTSEIDPTGLWGWNPLNAVTQGAEFWWNGAKQAYVDNAPYMGPWLWSQKKCIAMAVVIGLATDGIGDLALESEFAAESGARLWPKTAEEMDELLRTQGTRVPDGPMTPGRGKVMWRPNSDTKITYEQHPYHPDAPEWHRGPHWHLDTPGNPHQRYVPGDPIPGYDGN